MSAAVGPTPTAAVREAAQAVSVASGASWDPALARRIVHACWLDLSAYRAQQDPFARLSLRRPALVAADAAIWTAWDRRDLVGVEQAVAAFAATYYRLSREA